MANEFSVVQWFADDTYEYVRRNVSAEEAMKAFMHYTQSVGARVIGSTRKVVILDGGDFINMEWVKGRGVTYPPEHAGKLNV